uniref:AglZ/HisF2 family acetamidino modification protein n=1 Tax=Candidatus Electronema sp. TaxID=2698783 RepID=UPI004057576E
MLKHRVIPALLLKNAGLVKTLQFKNPKYVGDPINAIRIFNDKEVDELMVLDITASKEQQEPNYALIEQFAGECFMPLAYGGGIKTVAQAQQLFSIGVEKICIQSAVLNNPHLVTELAEQFGSQSIIVSIDIKRNWLGKAQIYDATTGKTLAGAWQTQLQALVAAGAGEVLLNAVDKDGTLSGSDLELIRQASQHLEVPLVAVGGISSLSDIKAAVDAGASAVAAGAFFVFHGPHRAVLITYPKYYELENLFKANK